LRRILSAWGIFLGSESGQEEVIVAFPFHNRSNPATFDILGYFVSVLPIRIRRHAYDVSFREVILETNRSISDALVHGQLPFVKILECASCVTDPSRATLYQAFLEWDDIHIGHLDFLNDGEQQQNSNKPYEVGDEYYFPDIPREVHL